MATIAADRALAVVRAPEIPDPVAVANALAQFGICALELTFTTPSVLDYLRAAATSAAVLGMGTVQTSSRTAPSRSRREPTSSAPGRRVRQLVRHRRSRSILRAIPELTPHHPS